MRLDKAISLSGMTRAEARRAIAAGRVKVGGTVVRDPALHAEPAEISIDGRAADISRHAHYMIHKPAGVLTATEDSRGERTTFDLLPESARRRKPGPVGRLDKDVTGLVLMTTDGQLAHRLISPKWSVEKIYLASIEGELDLAAIEKLQSGIRLSDFQTLPARVRTIAPGQVELTITEGKYHQVKRMLAAAGHPVTALARLSVGGVALDESLGEGECRPLTEDEIRRLYALVNLT